MSLELEKSLNPRFLELMSNLSALKNIFTTIYTLILYFTKAVKKDVIFGQ